MAEAVNLNMAAFFRPQCHTVAFVLAVSGFSFFGGNVNINSKLGGNYGA